MACNVSTGVQQVGCSAPPICIALGWTGMFQYVNGTMVCHCLQGWGGVDCGQNANSTSLGVPPPMPPPLPAPNPSLSPLPPPPSPPLPPPPGGGLLVLREASLGNGNCTGWTWSTQCPAGFTCSSTWGPNTTCASCSYPSTTWLALTGFDANGYAGDVVAASYVTTTPCTGPGTGVSNWYMGSCGVGYFESVGGTCSTPLLPPSPPPPPPPSMSPQPSSVCLLSYTTISDPSRRASNYSLPNTGLCDQNTLVPDQWYRFDDYGWNYINTLNLNSNDRCFTHAPGYLSSGSYPTIAEGVVNGTICYSFGNDPCLGGGDPVSIVQCQGFFLHAFPAGIHMCTMRVCSTNTVPANFNSITVTVGFSNRTVVSSGSGMCWTVIAADASNGGGVQLAPCTTPPVLSQLFNLSTWADNGVQQPGMRFTQLQPGGVIWKLDVAGGSALMGVPSTDTPGGVPGRIGMGLGDSCAYQFGFVTGMLQYVVHNDCCYFGSCDITVACLSAKGAAFNSSFASSLTLAPCDSNDISQQWLTRDGGL